MEGRRMTASRSQGRSSCTFERLVKQGCPQSALARYCAAQLFEKIMNKTKFESTDCSCSQVTSKRQGNKGVGNAH